MDENALRTVQAWLTYCRTSHPECQRHNEEGWYPTRLIDVLSPQETIPQTAGPFIADLLKALIGDLPGIRLIETNGAELSEPYMTLTHRWQDEPTFFTTKENMEQMQRSIDPSRLPVVFEQAVQVARRLGVRYLWIDSLCIIQNDENDKATEISTIGKVYANSLLTVSATAGGGQLIPTERKPHLIDPCIRVPRWRGTAQKPYLVTDFRFWDDRIYKSPVNKRCWITQERWLSPRVLHFAFDQLVWECRELEACETFFCGLPKETKFNKHTGFKQQHPRSGENGDVKSETTNAVDDASETRTRLMMDWRKILETYARTETTNLRDRMVGLSLVADRFRHGLDDELVAGLWRKTIVGELLWYVANGRRSNWLSNKLHQEATGADWERILLSQHYRAVSESVRIDAALAPSWSWTSVLGDIEMGVDFEERDESMVDVIDVSLELTVAQEPVFGAKKGALKLRGRLYPIHLQPAKRSYEPPRLFIGGLSETSPRLFEGGVADWKEPSHWVHLQADQPEEYTDVENSCFLPVILRRQDATTRRKAFEDIGIAASSVGLENKEEVLDVYGLCLKPTGKRGEYSRLGRIDFVSGDDADLFGRGFRAWKKNGFSKMTDDEHTTSLSKELYMMDEAGVFLVN